MMLLDGDLKGTIWTSLLEEMSIRRGVGSGRRLEGNEPGLVLEGDWKVRQSEGNVIAER